MHANALHYKYLRLVLRNIKVEKNQVLYLQETKAML